MAINIEVKYSKILDKLLYLISNVNEPDYNERKKICSDAITKFNKLEKNNFIEKIESITKIKFTKDIIFYFIPGWPKNIRFTAISDPPIITVQRPFKEVINLMIHELVHINLNNKSIKDFQEESKITRRHIIVHAILKEVYNQDQYLLDKKMCDQDNEFKKAWEIVDKMGSNKIISDFFN